MSRRTDGRGPTLADALRQAVAELLDTDRDAIVLELDGPGLEQLRGSLRFDLDVGSPTDAGATSGSDYTDAQLISADPTPRTRAGRGTTRPTAAAPVSGTATAQEDTPASEGSVSGEPASDESVSGEPASDEPALSQADLDEEADAAADFLEGLLDALDLPGDIRIRTADDHAEVEVVDVGSGVLIGRRGQTLESVQELVRCSLQREFQRRSHVQVDVEGYRSRRLEKLLEKAEETIHEVLDTGEAVRLEPMDVFERKSVHRMVADADGVISRSQGREPARRVVIERDG
jgi:spoIIIJ-associated protein